MLVKLIVCYDVGYYNRGVVSYFYVHRFDRQQIIVNLNLDVDYRLEMSEVGIMNCANQTTLK